MFSDKCRIYFLIMYDNMLYNEGYFIVPLDACTDVSEQWVTNGVTSDKLLLPQNDLIYWILKDYDVQFNDHHSQCFRL